jgi:hypothetical protein
MFNHPQKNPYFETKYQVDKFINGVTGLLKKKGHQIPKLLNFRAILKEFNQENLYADYIELSQYSHLSHHSTSIYQKNLGTEKTFTESSNIHR